MTSRLEDIRREKRDDAHVFSAEGIEGCLLCGATENRPPCPYVRISRRDLDLLLGLAQNARAIRDEAVRAGVVRVTSPVVSRLHIMLEMLDEAAREHDEGNDAQ